MGVCSSGNMFFVIAVAVLTTSVLCRAVEVPPPDGGDCWTSTFAIVQQEIAVALQQNQNDDNARAVERKYVFCTDTVYRIAALNPQTGTIPDATLGEQWPILLFNPNVHLYCPPPNGNCVLEMINEGGNVIFGAITPLVAGSGLIPVNLTVPPSNLDNLIIDGFVIRNADGQIYDDSAGVVTLGPPGRNMVVQNCHFVTVGLAGWVIASEYYHVEAQQIMEPPNTIYQSLTIRNCTFTVSKMERKKMYWRATIIMSSLVADSHTFKCVLSCSLLYRTTVFFFFGKASAFDRAAIIAFAVDAPPPSPPAVANTTNTTTTITTNQLILEDLRFTDISNTGTTFGGGWKGLISTETLASVHITNICFVDSTSPTGSMLELRASSNSISGFYSSGARVLDESWALEECIGGALIGSGPNNTTTSCVAPDVPVCPMDDNSNEMTEIPVQEEEEEEEPILPTTAPISTETESEPDTSAAAKRQLFLSAIVATCYSFMSDL